VSDFVSDFAGKMSELRDAFRGVRYILPTLAIAQAIRDGQSIACVPLDPSVSFFPPESSFVGDWLRELQRDFQGIKIELENAAFNAAAQASTKEEGDRLIAMGQQMLQLRSDGRGLHEALRRAAEGDLPVD